MEIKKKYSEIIDIIAYNNLYFNYEDTNFDSNGIATRTIIVSRSADISYYCVITIKEEADPESDQADFEANWMSKAGEKKYVYYSQTFVVENDGHTFDFKIKANDETTDVEAFLYKGMICVDESAVRGDFIEVSVVDIDNVLGHGENVTVGYVIRKKILHGGKQEHFINPPKYDFLSSKRKVPAGLYIRVAYHGSGRPNVICDYEYEY